MVQFDDSALNSRLNSLREKAEERAVEALAPQYGYEHIDLHGYTINPEAVAAVDETLARDAEITGFELLQHTLSVAIKDPSNIKTQAALQTLQNNGYTLDVFMTSVASLSHAWERYADLTNTTASKKGIFEISAKDILELTQRIKKESDISIILAEINTSNSSYRISTTLELIFAGALALRASDIHIEPESNAIRLRYRFDGVLHDIVDLDTYMYGRMMSRLKLLSGMVLNTRAVAQDGRFTFETGEKEVEIRSSVIPGAYGESIVMRLLDPTVASFKMSNLNLNQHINEVVQNELKKPNGLIITTGPTGSGKTTALYAFLQEVHGEGVKIITIENPVEYKVEGIVQTQVEGDYTFSSGLRAILRQDPDVILIGEIRDAEVAKTAMHAAQTGHLVLTTMHTNSAVAAFVRLMDLEIDARMFGSSVNLVLGQRLLRLLCKHCKVAHTPSPEEALIITTVLADHPHPDTVPAMTKIYTAPGCEQCSNTGFKGRSGIYEAIVMDDAVEAMVLNDPREHMVLEAAKPQGIPTMLHDGIEKVLNGLTSIKELERVIELPRTLTTSIPTETARVQTDTEEDDFLQHIV
jgi:type II secretory ATPase GspE/PulE/Tfp pilus assembly ATPase PilB-like protein